jgi:uncharacterized phage-associated protein
MKYDARQIANWFIERAEKDGRILSIMSLLKLAYIAHGWFLETRDKPLFENRIEAWKHGPVIPEVYQAFRPQGVHAQSQVDGYEAISDDDVTGFLEEIYKIYGNMSPFRLSDLTHTKGGPWDTATSIGGWYAKIPDELIHSHYIVKRQQYKAKDG